MTKRRAAVPPLSDAEETEIQAGIAQDPDNPEITDARFARMRPAREVLPPALYRALTEREGGSEFERKTRDAQPSAPGEDAASAGAPGPRPGQDP